ncbi:MAG: DUF222 domain-containing protein, partial [Euzebya sp.]
DPDTGMGCGRYALPTVDAELFSALLDSARTFDPKGCEPEERRTFEQRKADALMDLLGLTAKLSGAVADGTLSTSRGQRPHVSVTVPLSTLEWTSDLPGRTRDGQMISAAQARRLACDAALRRVVLGATGQVLDVGRATNAWSVAQVAAAEQTFGGCAFPVQDGTMCGQRSSWCDIHHVHWWRNGGKTDQANGAPLCRRHHTMVHHDGWDLTYDHEGQQVAVAKDRPDGSRCVRRVDLQRTVHSDGRVDPRRSMDQDPMTGPPDDGRLPL